MSNGMIVAAFLLMLGPLKLVGPFAALTSDMEDAAARRLGTQAIAFACTGGLIAAVLGLNALTAWRISPAALRLTAGVVLLLVALKAVLAQYEPRAASMKSAAALANPALFPLAFPTILTPYGIATFILVLAVTSGARREAVVVAIFLLVMMSNWLVMRYARAIVRKGAVTLALLGSVLGVLQVAIAIQMVINALRSLAAGSS